MSRSKAPSPPPAAAPRERAARFLERHWADILSSMDEGVVILDAQGRLMFFNGAAQQLGGLTAEQSRAVHYSQAFKANPWVIDMIDSTLRSTTGRASGEGELVGWRPPGLPAATPVRLVTSPILDAAGTLQGIVLLMHDVSRRREIEEEVREADRLSHLGLVAAGLAHEIRNPLAGIRGAVQLLATAVAPADARAADYVRAVLGEIDRLEALLERLLELGSPPPGASRRPLNIHKVLSEVLLLEREAAAPGVVVETRFDPSLPAVLGNEAQLSQVFRNLIKNAFQALAETPRARLVVSTRMVTDFHVLHSRRRRRDRFLSVEVEDNGPGIAPEHLPVLFTPFFTTKSNGKGLGLAVSRSLVVQHGGTIRVESEPGKGTLFRVTLPIAQDGGTR
jgi:two-component system nitrogen regulation sensor histidine kinase GlnL